MITKEWIEDEETNMKFGHLLNHIVVYESFDDENYVVCKDIEDLKILNGCKILQAYPLDGTKYFIQTGINDDSIRTRYVTVTTESSINWIQ